MAFRFEESKARLCTYHLLYIIGKKKEEEQKISDTARYLLWTSHILAKLENSIWMLWVSVELSWPLTDSKKNNRKKKKTEGCRAVSNQSVQWYPYSCMRAVLSANRSKGRLDRLFELRDLLWSKFGQTTAGSSLSCTASHFANGAHDDNTHQKEEW